MNAAANRVKCQRLVSAAQDLQESWINKQNTSHVAQVSARQERIAAFDSCTDQWMPMRTTLESTFELLWPSVGTCVFVIIWFGNLIKEEIFDCSEMENDAGDGQIY